MLQWNAVGMEVKISGSILVSAITVVGGVVGQRNNFVVVRSFHGSAVWSSEF